jgi:hypothetical protein
MLGISFIILKILALAAKKTSDPEIWQNNGLNLNSEAYHRDGGFSDAVISFFKKRRKASLNAV